MNPENMKIGDSIYRAVRYWAQEPTGSQHVGWNTHFEPYIVTDITSKRVTAIWMPNMENTKLQYEIWDAILRKTKGGRLGFDTVAIEKEKLLSGQPVYHSRYGEYFYLRKPLVDPEKRYIKSGKTESLSVLGLSYPCTKDDVKRAYKRLAKQLHPDSGGSHEKFIALNAAYEQAMRCL